MGEMIGKELGKPIATTVDMAATFWPAEAYHQEFWKGNDVYQFGMGETRAAHYKMYRAGCGKNAQVEALWGKTAFEGLTGHE